MLFLTEVFDKVGVDCLILSTYVIFSWLKDHSREFTDISIIQLIVYGIIAILEIPLK